MKRKTDGYCCQYQTSGGHEECRLVLEGMCEGIVRMNEVFKTEHPTAPEPSSGAIRYENPRMHKIGQMIGTTPIILERGKATCIEMACDAAARERIENDRPANVAIIDVMDPNNPGEPLLGEYHAVVYFMDSGEVWDPTVEMSGYPGQSKVGSPWYKAHGHCCQDCALGRECAGPAGGCDCKHHSKKAEASLNVGGCRI